MSKWNKIKIPLLFHSDYEKSGYLFSIALIADSFIDPNFLFDDIVLNSRIKCRLLDTSIELINHGIYLFEMKYKDPEDLMMIKLRYGA